MNMFSLITGLLLATAPVMTSATILPLEPKQEVVIEQKAELTKEQVIINKITEVFGENAPIMIKVARCESGIRQFDDKGQIIKNPVTPDYGLFQINLPSHEKKLEELKLDYRELDDNIAYAKYLFDKNGLRDWQMSAKCWRTE